MIEELTEKQERERQTEAMVIDFDDAVAREHITQRLLEGAARRYFGNDLATSPPMLPCVTFPVLPDEDTYFRSGAQQEDNPLLDQLYLNRQIAARNGPPPRMSAENWEAFENGLRRNALAGGVWLTSAGCAAIIAELDFARGHR